MSHKKLKYSDFPKKFNAHVVIDVRTMVKYYIQSATAVGALAAHIHDLGEDEFNRLPEEDRREISEVTMEEAMNLLTGRLLGGLTTDSLFDVIKAGPFQTTGGDIARKNTNFCIDRFVELAQGAAVTDEDREAADWMSARSEAGRVRREGANEQNAEDLHVMMESIFRRRR